MTAKINKMCYNIEGNSTLKYDKEVFFPINIVLAKTLKKQDKAKIILIKTKDKDNIAIQKSIDRNKRKK